MNADGSDQRQLTFDSQPKDQVPDWSPDGGKIAYLVDTYGIADMGNSWGDIWVMNANGSHQHQITSGATYYGTAWAPDGSRIATLDFPSRTIFTINARDGSDPQAVHPGGLQFVAAWQPLGTEDSQGEDKATNEVEGGAAVAAPPSLLFVGAAGARLRCAHAGAGGEIAPSCCISAIASKTPQCSWERPSSPKRMMSIN